MVWARLRACARIVKRGRSNMQVPGALRICSNNLHSSQCLELALAERPYTLRWGFFVGRRHAEQCSTLLCLG